MSCGNLKMGEIALYGSNNMIEKERENGFNQKTSKAK